MTMIDTLHEELKQAIRNIPDFPKKGIQFKDITTLIKDPLLLKKAVDHIASLYRSKGITKVVGIESRGFILGASLAYKLGAGFVPVRKPGKLPAKVYANKYELEYGTDMVEIHTDALDKNDVVLLHDDLLATGGTTKAVLELIEKFSVKKCFVNYLVELDFLEGRKKFGDNYNVYSVVHF